MNFLLKRFRKLDAERRTQSKVFLAFLLAFLVDQGSKYWWMTSNREVYLNTGVSFSIIPGPWWVVLLPVVLVVLYQSTCVFWSNISPWSRGIFFGCAVSNVVDRITLGAVRDILPIPFMHNGFNNLADWGLVLSLIWFLVQYSIHDKRRSHSVRR